MTGLVQRGINRGSVVVAVVILLLAAVVATFLVLRDDDRDPGAVSAAGEEGVWDPYAKLADGGRGATTAVRAQWEPVAEKFASVFLDPGRRAAWLSALRPLVADQLYAGLEEVEPRKVPDGTPGTLELVASGNRSVDVTITVDARTDWLLGLRLVDFPSDDFGWRVYGYEDRGPAS
ncbi:hypothetical protein HNR19_002162 [Nocardioides thalensis]|uniref:Uncharacterized protein n=1 Tax=Nocardioides thalensis TaxID=1914755 RepID=A0A853C2A3_9ACTN|nr:hypothetical protein [Nocardioides thalensis]NYJ01464.1 hypothetical protein [Nocardioides thalensis]